jgi:hypothetical protein
MKPTQLASAAITHLPLLGGIIMPLLLSAEAQALPQIQSQAIALKVIPALSGTWTCLACHYNGAGSASYRNLKPGLSAAFHEDTVKLTQLQAKLSELPDATVGLASSGQAKVDSYQVICNSNAVSLEFSVRDKMPVKLPVISAHVSLGANASPVTIDSVDGDANFSPVTKLVGGAKAIYTVKVRKSVYSGALDDHKGAEIYDGKLACRTRRGAQTGLAWRVSQNQ